MSLGFRLVLALAVMAILVGSGLGSESGMERRLIEVRGPVVILDCRFSRLNLYFRYLDDVLVILQGFERGRGYRMVNW